jgi:hypothetical protein
MPTIFRYKGIRFFFYSDEGDPREPMHVHARGNGNDAKFWLRPDVRIAFSDGFSRQEQLDLIRVVQTHREEIERAWNEHFGKSGPI